MFNGGAIKIVRLFDKFIGEDAVRRDPPLQYSIAEQVRDEFIPAFRDE